MKSSMAAPSFKNSGFDTTSNVRSEFLFSSSCLMVDLTFSAVPTGTVDLSMTTA